MQGQCKANAESLLYAEPKPVLAISSAKVQHFKERLSVFDGIRWYSMVFDGIRW
jgi:hypothetical protein